MSETTRTNGMAADFSAGARAAAEAAAKAPNNPPPDAVLGQVVWLMMNMPQYRHVFLADLEWMVLPPILLSQYRLFRVGDRVVAFAAWAYLSEAVETRLQGPNPRLAPSEWKSGDRLWLVDLHAPFGHQESALKELRETALKGKAYKMHRWTPQGRRTVEFAAEGSPAAV
jgi:cytolysin-activating lysine-acyltransferase